MNEQSRHHFIRSSALAVGVGGVLGAGIGQQNATAQGSGEVPAYAEWVPEGEFILNEQGELELGSYTLEAQIELFGEISGSEETPLQFEPLTYSTLLLNFWQFLGRTNLSEPILGSLTGAGNLNDIDPSTVPAERHTLVGTTSVYTGSFDTDEIESTVQNSDASETSEDGIFEFPTGETVTWGEGYLLLGADVEEVAAVQATGDGPEQPRYESSGELEQLLGAVDHSGYALTRLTDSGTLDIDQYAGSVDHSPIEGATGYVGTLTYDSDTTEFDATTVLRYSEEGGIDTDRIGSMVVNELDQEITTDGRTVRVTARYGRDEAGFEPSGGDDENDGNGGTGGENNGDDTGNETDSGGGAQNESNGGGDDESSDGNGAGFGIATAVSSLGGAGYLLSQRLGDDSE